MIYKFTVLRSTQSTKGGYINALQAETTRKVLGSTKTTKHLVNMKTDSAIEVGSEHEIDLDQFEIKTYVNNYINADGIEVVGENKWLHEKLV